MAAQTPSESCLHRNAEPSSPNRFWYRLICTFPDTSIATSHRSVSAAGPSQLHFCPHSHTECCADSQRIAHLACLSRGSDAMAFAMHLMPSTPIPFLYRKIVSSVFRATPFVWVCMEAFHTSCADISTSLQVYSLYQSLFKRQASVVLQV